MTAPRWLRRDPRARALADLRARDIVETREGWLVDLAAERRLAAVTTLAEDPGSDVHDALLVLLDDPLDEVRAAAVRALGGRGSDAGARACARNAPTWDRERFREATEAAWELLEHGTADDLAETLAASLLSRAATAPVAPGPADALAALVAGRPERADAALAVVVPRLGDRDPRIAARATALAARLGAGHEHDLLDALGDDGRVANAATALGALGSLDSVAPLGQVLLSRRPAPGRAAAARALGEIGGHDAVYLLRCAIDDPEPDVRRAVAAALTPFGGAGAADGSEALAARLLLMPSAPPAHERHQGNGHHAAEPVAPPAESGTGAETEHEVEPDLGGSAVLVDEPAVDEAVAEEPVAETAVAEETAAAEEPVVDGPAVVAESMDDEADDEPVPAPEEDPAAEQLDDDAVDDEFDDLLEDDDLLDDDEFFDDEPLPGGDRFSREVDDAAAISTSAPEEDLVAAGAEAVDLPPAMQPDAAPMAELDAPAPWSGPKTNGVPAVGPRPAPARAAAARAAAKSRAPRRRTSPSRGRAWPRGPRPGDPETDRPA